MCIKNIDLMIVGIVVAIFLVSISVKVDAELLFHYDFESKDLKDASGNKNIGEVRGEPQRVNGKVRMGLQFDGVDDYIFTSGEGSGPLMFTHDPFTEKSMALWVKADDVNDDHVIFEEGGTAQAYGIRINAQELYLSVRNGSTEATVTADYKDTNWHHIVGIYKEGDLHLYIDSKEVATGKAPYQEVGSHGNESSIGATFDDDVWGRNKADNPWAFFKGIMDEIYYYSSAITDKEINELYKQGAAVESTGKLTTTLASIKAQY
jgi:hypothetical protein